MPSSSKTTGDQQQYLAKIARLYYLKEMNQRDISTRLNISIASVSRALSRAKELGIVQITIDEPRNSHSELEVAMETKWHVNECMVVPSQDEIDQTYIEMARKTTEVMSRAIHDGSTVGVSWGKTLKSVGEHIGRIARTDVGVIPIIGAMGTVETGIYPNSIAREFADKFGGTTYLMNTPALVDTEETRNSLQRDSNFQMIREVWDRLDLVLLSVSALDEETSAYESRVFSREELLQMRGMGGICATNFSIIDSEGHLLDLPISRRITNLPFTALQAIPEVVMIAGGEKKIAPLRAALKTGIITKLITDEVCARALCV